MITIRGIADLRGRVGQELGVSDWHAVDRAQVDGFGQVTGDDAWIHYDEERAAATPMGTTIVHGLLTLSLEPVLSRRIYEIIDIDYDLDYGYAKVRFPTPVPVGARLRMRSKVLSVSDVEGGVRCTLLNTIELEHSDRPACVTELILHIVGSEHSAVPPA